MGESNASIESYYMITLRDTFVQYIFINVFWKAQTDPVSKVNELAV